MIDYFNEIFSAVANEVWTKHGQAITIKGEYVQTPKDFPTITIDEVYNVASELDNGEQKFADITIRVQVFTNDNAKRSTARSLFKTVSDKLYSLNLISKTYSTTPTIYNSSIYEIQATFEGTVDKNGTIYRR